MRDLLPWIFVVWCSFYASSAHAAETVVLFETPGLRPELCASLRIQLTDVASVECRPGSEGVLPDRLEQASRAVAGEGARAAVLLERDPDPGLVRMLLVGVRPDQAVLELERIEDRPDPDIDRSLSLKVRDAIEVMTASEEAVAALPTLPAVLNARTERRPLLLLEVGGGATIGKQLRALGVAGLGVRFLSERAFVEGALSAALASRIDEEFAEGRIDTGEWSFSLGARAARMFSYGSLGALLEAGLTRFDAHGITRAERIDGDARIVRMRAAVGIDVRLRLTQALHLRFAPALEVQPIAQEFGLNGQKNLDLGHFRALLPLSLVVDVPLLRARSNDAN